MTMTTNDTGELLFSTKLGEMSMHQLALQVRRQAGYATCGGFEREKGIEHPRWYDLERGRYKNPRLLLQVMILLGYEITINKGAEQ